MPLLLASLLLASVLAPGQAELSDWSAFPGDGAKSVGSEHVHDPTVVQIGGKAFCFSTSGDGFAVVRSSRDLKTWTVLGPIFRTQPAWLAARYKHKSIWAPDVVVLGKRVRVYYSASNFGTNLSVIGMAECAAFDPERPLEGWVDRGLVFESKPGDVTNAIDPEVVVDDAGRHWMYYGSYWAGIHVVELDPTTGKLETPAKPEPICVARNLSEPGDPIEGAAVLRRKGEYYLFVSYGLAAQGVRSTYRIMVGRSKSPIGPFLDRDGKSMVDGGHTNVLKTSPPMMSPGHCDVLTLEDGRTVMPYHFYDARRAWHGDTWGLPTLQIRELLWSAAGWPLPGLPIEAHSPPRVRRGSTLPPEGLQLAGPWLRQVDFGGPTEIEISEDGTLTGERIRGTWKREKTEIVLTIDRLDRTAEKASAENGTARPTVERMQFAYGGYLVGRDASGAVVRMIRLNKERAR